MKDAGINISEKDIQYCYAFSKSTPLDEMHPKGLSFNLKHNRSI